MSEDWNQQWKIYITPDRPLLKNCSVVSCPPLQMESGALIGVSAIAVTCSLNPWSVQK